MKNRIYKLNDQKFKILSDPVMQNDDNSFNWVCAIDQDSNPFMLMFSGEEIEIIETEHGYNTIYGDIDWENLLDAFPYVEGGYGEIGDEFYNYHFLNNEGELLTF